MCSLVNNPLVLWTMFLRSISNISEADMRIEVRLGFYAELSLGFLICAPLQEAACSLSVWGCMKNWITCLWNIFYLALYCLVSFRGLWVKYHCSATEEKYADMIIIIGIQQNGNFQPHRLFQSSAAWANWVYKIENELRLVWMDYRHPNGGKLQHFPFLVHGLWMFGSKSFLNVGQVKWF